MDESRFDEIDARLERIEPEIVAEAEVLKKIVALQERTISLLLEPATKLVLSIGPAVPQK